MELKYFTVNMGTSPADVQKQFRVYSKILHPDSTIDRAAHFKEMAAEYRDVLEKMKSDAAFRQDTRSSNQVDDILSRLADSVSTDPFVNGILKAVLEKTADMVEQKYKVNIRTMK